MRLTVVHMHVHTCKLGHLSQVCRTLGARSMLGEEQTIVQFGRSVECRQFIRETWPKELFHDSTVTILLCNYTVARPMHADNKNVY